MPNWKTHIEIGKSLNKYLEYNQKQLNLFLLGNILPDINNGYIVNNISKIIDHDITHVGNFINLRYLDFYKKYEDEINNKNPLFLGYLAHLYTDYNWNKDFYTSIEKLNIQKENRDELRIMKQNDFKIYNNKFIENIIELDNIEQALYEVNKIDIVSIGKEDIEKVIHFLKNQKMYEGKLEFYSIDKLDKIMDNTIKGFNELLQRRK